jgi:2-polyprenyl-3-methyl-5-hydroxy-6-metoxy-1,4-benzoquinol methylase
MSEPSSLQQMPYWERAGERGYGEAMYRCSVMERHIRGRCWQGALDTADELGVPPGAQVLDLGCGDGAFANAMLASRYHAVEGLDLAGSAIRRAAAGAAGAQVRFRAVDIAALDYASLPRYDAAFLMGILHHVKAAAAAIVAGLATRTDRVIVLEPNGDNILRKLLELTPSYRRAGEDSFRTAELVEIFAACGFRAVTHRRMNLCPNFTPGFLYRVLAPLEPRIEASSLLNALCTVNMFGFARSPDRAGRA